VRVAPVGTNLHLPARRAHLHLEKGPSMPGNDAALSGIEHALTAFGADSAMLGSEGPTFTSAARTYDSGKRLALAKES
jgi:hypothetical protein